MQRSDPLERLRAANPWPAPAVARLRPDPALFRDITSGSLVERRPSRPRRARLRVALPALLATSLVGSAVAYGLLRDTPSKPQTVACFEEASLEARTAVVAMEAEGALVACAEVWRRGVFGSGSREVPPLVDCVLPSGVAGVFPASAPGDDVCRRLTTPPSGVTTTAPPAPPPTQAEVNARFLAFRDAVLSRVQEASCLDPAAATQLVRTELDRAGLADWRIRSGEFTPDRPCATLSFRPENREIVLTPGTPRR